MKVLLVNPPYTRLEGIKGSSGRETPLGLLYLAAYIRQQLDCHVSILDAEVLGLSYSDIEKKLREEAPNLIGITCPTPVVKHVARIAEAAKKTNPNCSVVVGGHHSTALPEETVEIPGIDFAVIGEGEITFTELISSINRGESSFDHINGLAYRSSRNGVSITRSRSLIQDLDALPFPARDLVNLKAYRSAPVHKSGTAQTSTPIFTGRGCPYNCIFCASKLIWRQEYRLRSPGNIVDEIQECVESYRITEFDFMDDTFTFVEDHVMAICREIRKRKLNICWVCRARVDTISKEILAEIKKAGCRRIIYGVESGSQRVLDRIRKGINVGQVFDAVKMAKEQGMRVDSSFMLGSVGETKETMEETIKLAKTLGLHSATFFVTIPYPGTDLYTLALEQGYITQRPKWEDFTYFGKGIPPVVQSNVTAEELVNWQKRAFREFYLRPAFILQRACQIRSVQDIRTLLEGLGILLGIQRRTGK